MRICLYEDRRAADLGPLTAARPAFDLLCGIGSVADAHARHFAPDVVGHLVRPALAEPVRDVRPAAPVNDPVWLRAGPTVLVNGRWVPPAGLSPPTTTALFARGPFVATCGGEVAFAAATPDLLAAVAPATLDDCLDDWLAVLPRREVGGFVAGRPGDYVDRNGNRIGADFSAVADPAGVGHRPAGLSLIGPPDRLFIDPAAAVEPMVLADTTGGPVVVAAGASVAAFTRLDGPCFVGPGAVVLGGRVGGGTSIGPDCRVGGEVEASILQRLVVKARDGVLSRAFVGEGAELAAGSLVLGTAAAAVVVGDYEAVGPGVRLAPGAVVNPNSETAPRDQGPPPTLVAARRQRPPEPPRLRVAG